MIGGFTRRVFGPSRFEARTAVEGYRDLLRESIPGETFPVVDLARDYEDARQKHGWPPLDAATLLRELDALGMRQFMAIKVPWASHCSPPPALPMPKPEPVVSIPEDIEASEPEPSMRASARTLRPKVASGSTSQEQALADVRARLARGETMPSQRYLANAWGMSESRVCEWFRFWRAEKLVPPAKREGTCNVIQMPPARKAA